MSNPLRKHELVILRATVRGLYLGRLLYNTASESFVTLSSTGTRQKPELDESSFQQLLAAAFVVQQHNDTASSKNISLETSRILTNIAELQSLIRAGSLDVPAACSLVAERLLTMTEAVGVTISLINDGFLDCVAEAGAGLNIAGSCMSSHSLIATEKLKSGGAFESCDAVSDIRFEVGLAESLAVGALVSAPLQRFNEIAGIIEVRWSQSKVTLEGDLRACRLMGGLVSSMLERTARAQERIVSPGISPSHHNGVRIWGTSSASDAAEPQSPAVAAPAARELPSANAETEATQCCRVCGKPFREHESFCGFCRLPRSAASPSEELQSKWASLWYMQQAKDALQEHATVEPPVSRLAPVANPPRPITVAPAAPPEPVVFRPNSYDEAPAVSADLLRELEQPSLRERLGKIRFRWRDLALVAVAGLLGYGLVSAWPRSGSQLTWFQSLAVRVGLVHPQGAAPVFTGNPDARVWVDVHTSLYYCEGSDLYGKTPGGEFSSQHDAQSNQIEPAMQAACP